RDLIVTGVQTCALPILLAGPLDSAAPWLRVDGRLRAGGKVKAGSELEVLEGIGKPVVRLTHSLLLNIQAVVVVLSSRMRDHLARSEERRVGKGCRCGWA